MIQFLSGWEVDLIYLRNQIEDDLKELYKKIIRIKISYQNKNEGLSMTLGDIEWDIKNILKTIEESKLEILQKRVGEVIPYIDLLIKSYKMTLEKFNYVPMQGFINELNKIKKILE